MSKILSILALVYAIFALGVYQQTPLGQEPLLDAKENWVLAQGFLAGDTAPAYRAPLYAGFLSLLMRTGLDDASVLRLAQSANVLFHLLTALLLGLCARMIWHRRSAGYLAGLLYAVYPVALYLSFDLLDTALANLFAALGLFFLMRTKHRKSGFWGDGFLSLLAFSLAALTRSHFLVWLGFGAFFLLRESAYRRVRPIVLWGGLLGALLILGGYVGLERMRTGQWAFLPTQTAYNLYAANEPGASGEAFVQKVEFANLPSGVNPARAQAEYLYRKQTGNRSADLTEATINSYWRHKFWEELALDPQQKLTLYGHKFYAMFHLHEGYNNKTYAFQKTQNSLLAANPLNFLWVSALALAGWLLTYPRPREAGYLLGLTLIYAAAAAVFYASDRFRLPMVLPLCVLAGSATMILPQLRIRLSANFASALLFIVWRSVLIVAWIIFFSLPMFGVGQRPTQGADYLLVAQAALNQGKHTQALDFAQRAQQAQPNSQTATEVALKAHYNAVISGELTPTSAELYIQLQTFQKLSAPSRALEYMAGYYEWLLNGSRDRWHNILSKATPGELYPNEVNALAALVVTNSLYPNEIALLQAQQPCPEILQVALASLKQPDALAYLRQKLGPEEAAQTIEAYRNLFDRQHFIGLNGNNAH